MTGIVQTIKERIAAAERILGARLDCLYVDEPELRRLKAVNHRDVDRYKNGRDVKVCGVPVCAVDVLPPVVPGGSPR